MRTNKPRLPPLKDEELSAEQEAVVAQFRGNGDDRGIVRTFARHPALLRAYNVWASHTFSSENTLTKRESEIITMRTVWRCKAGYQWSRHVPMGLQAGLTDREIEALKKPVDQGGWTERDAVLISCVDALNADCFIPDELWEVLTAHFSEQQCIDAIFLCGRYVMAAMFLNTAGTPIDPDVVLDPDLDMSGRGTDASAP
jgi:alkylhydroperoxidase family enzyme